MMGLGVPELLVILVIALVIFGAGKLPEIGSSLGKSIQNFKKASENPPEPAPLPQAPAAGAGSDDAARIAEGGVPPAADAGHKDKA